MLGKILLGLSLLSMPVLAAEPMVIGYYPYWAHYSGFTPKDIRTKWVTHVNYGYLIPGKEGALELLDSSDVASYEGLVALGKEDKFNLVISVGGPGNGEAMKNGILSHRDALLKSIVSTLNKTEAVGIEIDWLPDASNSDNYLAFIQSLKSAVGDEVELSIVLPTEQADVAQIPTAVLQFVDYAVVQPMDIMLTNKKVTLEANAGATPVEDALEIWTSKGIPANKLVPAVPLYGRAFAGAQGLGTNVTGVGSGNDGWLAYRDIMDKLEGTDYKVTFDEESGSEIAVSKEETISFVGIPSVKAVATQVKDESFAGIAFYDLSAEKYEWKVSVLVTAGLVLRPKVEYKKK